MTAEALFLAIGGADEEFLAHSEEPVRKKPASRRAWAAAAACLALALAGTWALRSTPGGEKVSGPQGGGGNAAGCADEFPGGIDPVLRVNGELYHWYGVSLMSSGDFEMLEDGSFRWHTYLPEGYEPVGEVSSVTESTPTEELQIQAGIPFTGTVYTNPEAPLVVYARLSSEYRAEGHVPWVEDYVRFVSGDYQPGLIRLDGKLYWFAVGQDKYSERVEELPEGCVSAGTIRNIVWDRLPANELEANDIRDSYNKSLWGREVFRDPADSSVIYFAEEQYWSGGHCPAWRACHLWEGN